jgi:hypothetical protein
MWLLARQPARYVLHVLDGLLAATFCPICLTLCLVRVAAGYLALQFFGFSLKLVACASHQLPP